MGGWDGRAVKLVLDTHALIWSANTEQFDRLSPAARDALDDRTNEVFVSAASAWEVALKHRRDRLPEGERIVRNWPALVDKLGANDLPVSWEHGLLAGAFPSEHRDPFDRIIAAQAIIEDAHLVTADRSMRGFGAQLLW